MANIKAEVLASILADAKTAKELPGRKNVYSPENYNKLATQSRAMGLMNDGEYLEPKIKPGSFEWDHERHCLKKIARNEPKLLDLNQYCANRYMLEKNTVASGKDKAGTYIVLIRGMAAVQMLENSSDLTATVIAYRFKKVNQEIEAPKDLVEQAGVDENGQPLVQEGEKVSFVDWEYQGTEVMAVTEARNKLVRKLNNEAAFELFQKIDNNPNPRYKGGVEGDSLDDLA